MKRLFRTLWVGHRIAVTGLLIVAVCAAVSASAYAGLGARGDSGTTLPAHTLDKFRTTETAAEGTLNVAAESWASTISGGKLSTAADESETTEPQSSRESQTEPGDEERYAHCVGVVLRFEAGESLSLRDKRGVEIVLVLNSDTVIHVAGGQEIKPGFQAEALYVPGEQNVAVRINAQKIVKNFTGVVKDYNAPGAGAQGAAGSITVTRGGATLTFVWTETTEICFLGKARQAASSASVGVAAGSRVSVRYDLLYNALVIKVLPSNEATMSAKTTPESENETIQHNPNKGNKGKKENSGPDREHPGN
ncbi:MAG: hypothetical protein N3B14_02935 [Thermoleophilia bacterium]|nr:hypothetical protein [Thermoleophilia bacterium]